MDLNDSHIVLSDVMYNLSTLDDNQVGKITLR